MTSPFGFFWKFQKCKYEHACHGAYNSEILNDTRITSKKLKELILNDTNSFNEICDESKGYKKTENRLCATCLVGYKRFGGSTKCEKCPPSAENRLMIGIGFLVLIIGSTIMVYVGLICSLIPNTAAIEYVLTFLLLYRHLLYRHIFIVIFFIVIFFIFIFFIVIG